MNLFTYEFKLPVTDKVIPAAKAFKSARGANSAGLAFKKQMGNHGVEIRVVRLVPKGTGRVVAPHIAEIGEWH